MRPKPHAPLLSTALLALALAVSAVLFGGCSPAVRGSMALASGDYGEALARYQEALNQEPGSVYLRKRIGLTYMAMGDYPRAEAIFDNALLLAPGEPEASFYLGLSRIGKGEVAQGLDQLTRLHWPFKFHHQKFVQEEAQRLQGHPELPLGEVIRSLQEALAAGRAEQERAERESLRMES